ncbi:MAG: hypothetical protein ACK5MV_08390 [Aminipila sp.]
MEYIQVQLVNMPVTVRGFTLYNSDDSYTISINCRLSCEMQTATYDHEIEHINNRDFDKIYNVDFLYKLKYVW